MNAYKQCAKEGCHLLGMYVPQIFCAITGVVANEKNAPSMFMQLEMCQKHAKEFDAKTQFADERTSAVWRNAFRVAISFKYPGTQPDFDRVWVKALEVTSPLYLGWLKAQQSSETN